MRTFVSIVAGFLKVPPLLFGVLSLIGTAVWVTVISLVGYGVGSAWQSVAHGLAVAGYVIFALAVIGIAAFITYRVREVRREAAHGRGGPGAGGRGSNGTDGRASNGTGQRGSDGTDQRGSGTDQSGPGGTGQRGSGGTGQRGSGGAHRRGSSDQHGAPPGAEHDPQSSPRSPTS